MMLDVLDAVGAKFIQERTSTDAKPANDPCPKPEQIARFILGLSEREEEMIDHLRSCERCRLLVNAVSEAIENAG
jgi:hypothetical protein